MVGWCCLAAVLALAAISWFVLAGENDFVRVLWLGSIGALLIAPLVGLRIGLPHIAAENRPYLIALAIVLAIAFLMRVYRLTLLPFNVDGDFAEFGSIARSLVTGQQQNLFAYDDWGRMPILGHLPAWLTMSIFGANLFGLYASGVIEGLAVIVGVYLLGRDLFHARVGLFAAALSTVSYAHLLASRQSNFIDPVPFMIFAIYFLLVGWRERRGWALAVSGVLTALCVQMYFSGRLIVPLVGFIFLYFGVLAPTWLWERRRAIAVWVFAVLVTLGPMLVVFAADSGTLMARSDGIFVLNPNIVKHLESKYGVDSVPAILFEQARRTALLFNYYPDTGPQFSFQRPFLDSVLGSLFVLGMGYALVHWRRLGHALLVVWVFFGAVFGSFLTSDAPSWSRLMILLPPTALLAARALELIYELVRRVLSQYETIPHYLSPVLCGALIVTIGVMNWNTYVGVKGTYASEVTRMARYLNVQSPSTHCYLVSSKFTFNVRELKFLVPGRCVASLATDEITANIPRVGSPTLLFLTNEQGASLETLKRLYPTGAVETHSGNAPDEVAFYVFRLP
jgi:4-amino-4-deoxy-L-arabinose transferase-like glycosyltransferase